MTERTSARLAARLQRFVLSTSEGPLRHLWWAAYTALTWAWSAWLRGGARGATAYATRGIGARMVRYGISDIDIAVVVPADPDRPGRARSRVLARHELVRRTAPWLARTILDQPLVLEGDDLAEAASASTLTCGLAAASPPSVYFGPSATQDRIGLHENPGLRGPLAGWRRLGGCPRVLPDGAVDRSRLRIAAWLELQSWWRRFLQACADPPAPDAAYLCLKLVAEPARIWLALSGDEVVGTRRDVLERVLRVLPEEEATIRWALALDRDLVAGPDPPMAEALTGLVGFSDRIAGLLAEEAASAGTLSVSLDWSAFGRLAVGPGARDGLLPLADWRALVRAGLRWEGKVWTAPPDETLAPVGAGVGALSLDAVVSAVREGNHGPYPALRTRDLLILASRRWPRTQLRAVQCALTDPVSFALLQGLRSASFPDLPGWSAADTAARAVAEHRAWLAHPDGHATGGDALAMLVSAVRAALFLDAVAAGSPVLTPTVEATLGALRARWSESAGVIDEAEAAYFSWRRDATVPPDRLLDAFRRLVAGLRPFAGGD